MAPGDVEIAAVDLAKGGAALFVVDRAAIFHVVVGGDQELAAHALYNSRLGQEEFPAREA